MIIYNADDLKNIRKKLRRKEILGFLATFLIVLSISALIIWSLLSLASGIVEPGNIKDQIKHEINS